MEISKLNELYSKIIQKYSFDEINTDKNNEVTQEEILTLAYQDENLRAELDDSDLELIKDFIAVDNSQQTSMTTKVMNSNNLSTINSFLSNLNNSDMMQLIVYLCTLLQSSGLKETDLVSLLQNNLDNTNSKSTNSNKNNANYECLKSTYQKYLENCDKVKEKAQNGEYSSYYSQQLDINEKPINVPLSTSYWTGEKEFDKWRNINLKDFDMDGDGKLTTSDLKLLPEEFDLDGNGEITEEEKTFLKKIKIHLYFKIRQQILSNRSKISTENIDEIISFLEYQENDELIQKTTKSAKSYIDRQGQSGKQIINEDSSIWAYYGISATYIPPLTFQNIKTVNKDLSKEELTEILNKINSASASVQSKLAEVKKAVEEKLEAMS